MCEAHSPIWICHQIFLVLACSVLAHCARLFAQPFLASRHMILAASMPLAMANNRGRSGDADLIKVLLALTAIRFDTALGAIGIGVDCVCCGHA